MKDNKYRQYISEIKLSENKKTEIKDALRVAQKKRKETSVTVVSKPAYVRKTAFKWTAVAAVFVLVIACVGLYFSPSVYTKPFKVNDPISAEDSAFIANVTENAQYLPNADILASTSKMTALSSGSTAGKGAEVQNGYDGDYSEVYKVDNGFLDYNAEEYELLNDSLAKISGTATGSDMTVEDLKKEINVAVDLIPGYDQWFRLPYYLPHLSEDAERLYNNYSYYLSYDKEKDKITMKRLCWKTRGETYDTVSGTFYDDAYQRQYIVVEYYHDEEEREVVDCTVINYLCVTDNVYYPVSAQRLINVKDFSTTKYAATYMREHDFVKPISGNDEAFDANEHYDYGINTIIVQLNYTSSEDIRLLKTEYATADKYQQISTSGELAYYVKSADSTSYYVAGWDNRNENYNEQLAKYYRFSINEAYLDDKESWDYYHDRVGESIIRLDEIRRRYVCDFCINSHRTSDGIFIYCSHGFFFPTVNRSFSEIVSDNEDVLKNADIVYDGIRRQFSEFTHKLQIDCDIVLNPEGNEFGNSVNTFIVEFGKKYYQDRVVTVDFVGTDAYELENVTRIDEEEYAKIAKSKNYNFTYNVEDDSVLNKLNVRADLTLNANIADVDAEADYYLCLKLENVDNENDYEIIGKVKIDAGTDETITLEYDTTVNKLLEACLRSGFNSLKLIEYKLTYSIVKYKDRRYSKVTPSRVVDVDYGSCFDYINNETTYISENGTIYQYFISPYKGGISFVIYKL